MFKEGLEIFKLRNEPKHNLKFQVDPPFNFTDSVQNITLEDSEKSVGTTVVVTGWGDTSVSQFIKYCVEQQQIFYQNSSQRPPHITKLPLRKMAYFEPD